MSTRVASWRVLAILGGVLVMLLALRFCGDATPDPVPAVEGVAAPASSPETVPPRKRAERPIDAPPPPAIDASPSTAAPVLPPEFRRAKPAVLVVTCGGRPVAKCSFAVARATGPDRAVASLTAHPGGRYELDVDEDIDFPATIVVRAQGWPEARAVVPARETPVEVQLPEGGRVTGRATFPDGRAIAGARVTLAGRAATADADGRFTFDDVAVGRHTTAQVATASFLRSVPCDVNVEAPGDSDDVTLIVNETISLRARVVRDADGVPVPNATVCGEGWGDGEHNQARAATDVNGVAELRGLRDGDYRLAVFGDDIEAAFVHRTQVPREDLVEVRTVPYVLRTLAGRVVDPTGRPVPGLSVQLFVAHAADSHRTTTGKDGSFRITGIRSFRWMGGDGVPSAVPLELLSVNFAHGKDGGDFLMAFLPPSEGQTIVWAPKTTLSVVVRDLSGAPLPDINLDWAPPDGTRLSRGATSNGKVAVSRVDWYGRFAAPGTLTVRLADGRTATRDIPRITGERTTAGEVAFEACGRLRLVVTPTLGDGAVSIAVRDAEGRAKSTSWASAASKWTTTSVRVGVLRVVVSAPGRMTMEVPGVEVRAGEITPVAVTLPHPADLAVFVRRAGRPATGVRVRAEPVAPPPGAMEFRGTPHVGRASADDPPLQLDISIDVTGRAVFHRLPPGRVRVIVAGLNDGRERVVEADLADGERASLDVTID